MKQTLIGLGLLALLALYSLHQKNTITEQKGQLALLEKSEQTLEAQVKTANATIATLRMLEKNRKQQQNQLQQTLTQLEKTQSKRQQQTREVHHAPQNIDWANQPLPADVKRLRKRPHITTTADYLQYLHNAQPVQPKGHGTRNQRRAKPSP